MSEKILVIDSDPEVLKLCREELNSRGYRVTTAQTDHEGIHQMRQEDFDVLLTNIQDSGDRGNPFFNHVNESQRDLASIILTEQAHIKEALQGLHQGAHGILLKPFTRPELSQCIVDALEKNRLSKENIRLKLLLPLFEVSHGCLHHEDMNSLLNTVSKVLKRELKAFGVALFLQEAQDQGLFLHYEEGLHQYKEDLFPMAEWVSQHGEPLILLPHSPSEPPFQRLIFNHNLSSALGFPIRNKQEILGSLILLRKTEENNLTQTDIEFMTILLNHLAIALDNLKLFGELEASHFEAIQGLAEALEAKDAYTRGHSDRTVKFAVAIADHLGLTPEEKDHVKYGAILHDIGKIGITESILNKPGRLTEKEFEVMKKHPELGANIVKQIKFLAPVAPLVYHHQERFDGKGYPKGLSGKAIPMGSRIIAVLDAFDAMTSDRVYRKAPGKERAIIELKRFSGTQFDPQVVETFLNLLQDS